MSDQAKELRELVRNQTRRRALSRPTKPRLLVVSGGKGGVGTTTVAVNLAVNMSRTGLRTILVDADLESPHAAPLNRMPDPADVDEAMSGRCPIDQAMQTGPAGVGVVAGDSARRAVATASDRGPGRLLQEIAASGKSADMVVLDAGSALNRTNFELWQTADNVIVVTTDQSISVMDAYAAIKILLSSDSTTNVHVLVNQARDLAAAADAFTRLSKACRRFLGVSISSCGSIAVDERMDADGGDSRPFCLREPESPVAHQFAELASVMTNQDRHDRRLTNWVSDER